MSKTLSAFFWKSFLGLHLAMFSSVGFGQWTDVPADEWEQVVAAAEAGWQSLRQAKPSWRADVISEFTFREEGKERKESYRMSVNQGIDCGLIQTHSPTSNEITAWSDAYSFRLYRKAKVPETPYKISYVGKDEALRLQITEHYASAYRVFGQDADTLLQNDTFRIEKLARSDDGRFVSITFSSDFKSVSVEDFVIKGGAFTIDMGLSAAVIEYDIFGLTLSSDECFYNGKVKYVENNGGLYPHSATGSAGLKGEEPHTISVTEFKDVRPADLKLEDCRLSAFGFPEPGLAEQSQTGRWRATIVLVNVAVVLAGVIVWWISRRRSA